MSSRIVPEAGRGGERAGGAVTGRGGSTGLPPGGGPPFRRTVEERGSSSFKQIMVSHYQLMVIR